MALTKDQKKIKELESKITDLESKLKCAEESRDRYSQMLSDKESEMQDLHAMLDEFPNAPARKRKRPGYYGDFELSVQSRLSAWFSSVFIATATDTKFPMTKLQKEEDES